MVGPPNENFDSLQMNNLDLLNEVVEECLDEVSYKFTSDRQITTYYDIKTYWNEAINTTNEKQTCKKPQGNCLKRSSWCHFFQNYAFNNKL